MTSITNFSAKVREKLGYYVYLYIDPRDNRPFYIGKGKGTRVFGHLKRNASESKKRQLLEELETLGLKPQIEILKYGLTQEQALLVEATAIDLMDVKKLTNLARGHGSRHASRGSVADIAAILDAREAKIREPTILININKSFRYGMSTHELYDATRSAWILGPRRKNAKFAMSVYRGIVRQVYKIAAWVPAAQRCVLSMSTVDIETKAHGGNSWGRWPTKHFVENMWGSRLVAILSQARKPPLYM